MIHPNDILEITDRLLRAKICDGSPDYNRGTAQQFEAVVRELAGLFKAQNPRFGRERWVEHVLAGAKMLEHRED